LFYKTSGISLGDMVLLFSTNSASHSDGMLPFATVQEHCSSEPVESL